ncbi:uncharacterized protein LOC107484044 [Arachis duranensis]|uniref:Uncharacterized protein LOC107484044 n=1 Tax=Arachis duranensis TaxID=130453 RepID=A0A6P4D319_ARADU|nr:uncharacterized protein LOC107484044 [Arachis duranensis]
MVRADASVSIKVLLNATAATHFGFRLTYRRVWLAKQKAVALIYGDWDESYNELPRWVLGVQLTMAGTVAVLKTSPVRVGGQLDESRAYFHRVFWTFPPCIEAFHHCKPLISIDGTHLYGKYGGTLLVAIAQDGNSNILPVAFALVEGENAESWSFFLSHLREHVTPQPGLLVISDRHNGIKATVDASDEGWLPPSAYRAFCIRHVAANFALTFKGKDARRLLVNAAYAKTEVEFYYWFDILRSEDPAMCDWANRIEYSLWTQHCDEGRRFRHMTTNISECVNSILKGVRNLPVCSLVKATYGRLAGLFVRKGREAEAQMGTGQQFSQHLVKCIEANLKMARCFTVTVYDRDNSEFTVAETTPTGSFSLGSYRVSLAYQTCDCGYFQALHFRVPTHWHAVPTHGLHGSLTSTRCIVLVRSSVFIRWVSHLPFWRVSGHHMMGRLSSLTPIRGVREMIVLGRSKPAKEMWALSAAGLHTSELPTARRSRAYTGA